MSAVIVLILRALIAVALSCFFRMGYFRVMERPAADNQEKR